MQKFYPSNLKYEAQRDGHKVPKLGLPSIKSPMQSGKTRYRPQFTLRITEMNVSIHFTPMELGRFLDFVNYELGNGTAEFSMPVWIASANEYQPRIVQIKDAVEGVSIEPLGVDDSLVSFTLNVRNL